MSSATSTDASDARPPRSSRATARRGGPVARLARFFREIIAELRKVLWPSRNELVTYTVVVIVFVSIMVRDRGGAGHRLRQAGHCGVRLTASRRPQHLTWPTEWACPNGKRVTPCPS